MDSHFMLQPRAAMWYLGGYSRLVELPRGDRYPSLSIEDTTISSFNILLFGRFPAKCDFP